VLDADCIYADLALTDVFDAGSSAKDIHPRIALDFCLRSFVELHDKEILSWKLGGIQQILDWLVHSIDPGWQEQVSNRITWSMFCRCCGSVICCNWR
jgi:hypothetical protein